MTRDRPSQTSKRISSSATPFSGATAALQLLPVAAFMVDGIGALQGCNELFEAIAGVPHELLLGREWWQAFAARSAETASRAHEAIVCSGESRGEVTLDLIRSDGAPATLSIRWLRVTEPGTRRPVWILSAFDVAPAPARAVVESPSELASLLAREIDAIDGDVRRGASDSAVLSERLSRMSAALRARSSSDPVELPLADVLKRAVSGALHDPTHPVRLKVEANGTLRAHPIDPARVLSLVVEHGRARSASPLIVRVFECPAGVCFEVQDYGPALDAESQARVRSPRLFDRDASAGPATALETAAAMVQLLGGAFSIECSLSGPQTVRFSIPPR